jgi:hypothetical protein
MDACNRAARHDFTGVASAGTVNLQDVAICHSDRYAIVM